MVRRLFCFPILGLTVAGFAGAAALSGDSLLAPDGGAPMDERSAGPALTVETPSGLPNVLREDDTPVDSEESEDREDPVSERYLTRGISWMEPDYSRQEGALGWEPSTFKVPVALAKRVAFWKMIYSTYTTHQGVLHDPDQPELIYQNIDFQSVGTGTKSRSRLVEKEKGRIVDRLKRLSQVRKLADLRDSDDRRLFAFFSEGKTEELFLPTSKKNLESVKREIKLHANRKQIRFQLGQKDKFILGVYYSGRYLREMEKIFREERLPIELTRLPFVESSFDIQARSRVGASGIWQFMPRTAKPAMMVGRDVDERNDPLRATTAAARLLRANYERLGSWPLALTAYNHGATGVSRAVKKTGSRDLGVIIENYENRRFGFASSNFYACFLAALEVERTAESTLGAVKWSEPFAGVEVEVRRPMAWKVIVTFYDGESALAELQNPHLMKRIRQGKAKIPQRTFIRVPLSRREVAEDWARGRIDEKQLTAQLKSLPIELPQPRAAFLTKDDFSGKLGGVSEAVQAILPFFSDEAQPTPTPVGPDGGPAL